jgi:hypothetical protein
MRLDLTQRQVRAICEGARKAGFTPEIIVGKTVVRLVPDNRDVRPQAQSAVDAEPDPETFESLSDYIAWRDRNRARENQGHS